MAILGKRKAPESSVSQEEAAEIFRRHFEAQFRPLAGAERKVASDWESDGGDEEEEDEIDSEGDEEDDGDSGEGSENEWGGLSDDEVSSDEDESTPAVEVVDHSTSQAPKPAAMSKRELKAFMSSRPPDQTDTPKETPTPSSKPSGPLAEDAPSLLAQDLELRRLIAESHLLSSKPASFTSLSSTAEPRSFTAGRTRQKATDMRVQALGSKGSILKQEKMPMHMRKGMVAAEGARESKRRREAKENGVILERETTKKKGRDRARDGVLDRPGVGKMKGAHLTISDRDVKRIEGTRDTFGRKGGKR